MTDTTNLLAEAERRAAWHENEAHAWRSDGGNTPLAREHDNTVRTLRALAAALRQAEARGMREAAAICNKDFFEDCGFGKALAREILAAADAKEKPDAP